MSYLTAEVRLKSRRKPGTSKFFMRDGIRYKTCTQCGAPWPYNTKHYRRDNPSEKRQRKATLRSECKWCGAFNDKVRKMRQRHEQEADVGIELTLEQRAS
jgi:hypothetical protein